jgi:hypothetical protein
MKDLIAALTEAQQNLERAQDSLDCMYGARVPAGSINHMSQSVRTWRAKVAALQMEIRATHDAERLVA